MNINEVPGCEDVKPFTPNAQDLADVQQLTSVIERMTSDGSYVVLMWPQHNRWNPSEDSACVQSLSNLPGPLLRFALLKFLAETTEATGAIIEGKGGN